MSIARDGATAALLTLLACSGASAASFDCQQAKTPVELAICGNAALSALDVRMAQTYQRALQALSPAGAAALKASQRSWLRYVSQVCVPALKAKTVPHVANEACLTNEWQNRLRGLDQAGLKLGALVLTHVDHYNVRPGPPGDNTGSAAGWVSHHVGHLQIDGAGTTPAELAWNKAQVPPPLPALPRDIEDDDSADTDSDVLIGCANERLLSLETTASRYDHGAAHGVYAITVTTTLLKADLRTMTAADLFTENSGWRSKLPTLFWQSHLSRTDALRTEEAEQAIRAAASDESRWLVTPVGLQISLAPYEAGSYAGTPGPITVPWPTLKSLLIGQAAPACDFSSVGKP